MSLRHWVWLVILAGLCFLPLLTDPYTQYIFNLMLVYAVIAIGLNLALGFTGLFVFAHAAFMAIGAYSAALLSVRLGIPILLALPLGGLLAGVTGFLITIPAIRLKGVYLAMVTLAFGELVHWILVHWKHVTGGVDGIIIPAPSLFGRELRGDTAVFYIVLVVSILMVALAKVIVESKLGRAFVAVRDSEAAAACNGINVAMTKSIALVLSAFYAGIGGGLFSLTLHYISPGSFGLAQTILHFCMVVIGGLGSLSGSIIGAILLTALPELLRRTQAFQEIAYGGLLIVFILFAPRGIVGLLQARRLWPREILVSRGSRSFIAQLKRASG